MKAEKIEALRKRAFENLERDKGQCLGSERLETLDSYENILELIEYIGVLKSQGE